MNAEAITDVDPHKHRLRKLTPDDEAKIGQHDRGDAEGSAVDTPTEPQKKKSPHRKHKRDADGADKVEGEDHRARTADEDPEVAEAARVSRRNQEQKLLDAEDRAGDATAVPQKKKSAHRHHNKVADGGDALERPDRGAEDAEEPEETNLSRRNHKHTRGNKPKDAHELITGATSAPQQRKLDAGELEKAPEERQRRRKHHRVDADKDPRRRHHHHKAATELEDVVDDDQDHAAGRLRHAVNATNATFAIDSANNSSRELAQAAPVSPNRPVALLSDFGAAFTMPRVLDPMIRAVEVRALGILLRDLTVHSTTMAEISAAAETNATVNGTMRAVDRHVRILMRVAALTQQCLLLIPSARPSARVVALELRSILSLGRAHRSG
jgi:hypothetical protein